MRALSIRPPWAYAIAHLGKRVENRGWTTSYRGPILIHASKNLKPADTAALRKIIGRNIDPARFAQGAVVAIADLVDVVPAKDAPGRWTVGPFAWRLRNVRVLSQPIPCSGKLGLWKPDAALIRRVRRSLGT